MDDMIRKIWLGILILIIIAFFGWMFLNNNASKMNLSLRYLRSGNLEKGLEVCEEIRIDDYSDACYLNYLGRKINNNEPYDQSICSKISEKRGSEKEKLGCYV